MKIKLDSIEEISELKEARNSIKNPYMDLQRRKAYITSKKDGKLFRYHRCLGWGWEWPRGCI